MRESTQAMRAYQDYQAQAPPRSLERLAKMYQTYTEPTPPTRHLETLKRWSVAHKWQERIAAYEKNLAAEAEEQQRHTRLAEVAELREQRLLLARSQNMVARRWVMRILRQIEQADQIADPEQREQQLAAALAQLSLGDIIRMIKEANATERLEMGEVTKRQTLRLEGLSDAELSRLLVATYAADEAPGA